VFHLSQVPYLYAAFVALADFGCRERWLGTPPKWVKVLFQAKRNKIFFTFNSERIEHR
jgi:hypothetical protein